MGLLSTTLGLLLLASPPSPLLQAKTPEEIGAYRKELEAALEPGVDAKIWRRKIVTSRDHVDASVIALLDAKALRHSDRAVRDAAVMALGHMNHPDARKVLAEMFARDEKELEGEPPRYANLVKAIARNGDSSAIELLTKDLFQHSDSGVIRARILGLGNIRTKESVDELVQMMRSAARPRVAEVMFEMRVALFMLTGVDKGTDPELWINWYGDAKNALVIAPEPPAERPPEIRRCWTMFWGPEIATQRVGGTDKEKDKVKDKGKEKRGQQEKDGEKRGDKDE